MSRTAGHVTPKQAAKNLRRFQFRSTPIVMNNGATSNLVTPIGFSPTGARLIIDSIVIYNYTAVSNHALGTLKIGTADEAGTLDDDSLLSVTNAVFDTIKKNTAIHHRTTYQAADMLSTLKVTVGHPYELNRPIVPVASTIVATATGMGTGGTGSIVVGVFGWEADDEND